jgi:hypothetical protein
METVAPGRGYAGLTLGGTVVPPTDVSLGVAATKKGMWEFVGVRDRVHRHRRRRPISANRNPVRTTTSAPRGRDRRSSSWRAAFTAPG